MPHYNYLNEDGSVEIYSTMVSGTTFRGTPEEFIEHKATDRRGNFNPDKAERLTEQYCENEWMIDEDGDKTTLPEEFCRKRL